MATAARRLPRADDLPADPGIDSLSAEVRQFVGRAWARRAGREAMAARTFVHVAHGLLVDRTSPEVRFLAQRAVADELRHASLCRLVADRYDASAVTPSAGDVPEPRFDGVSPEHARLLNVVGNCCLSETIAVAFLEQAYADSTGPLAKEATRILLADEMDHARIGWGHLASGLDGDALTMVVRGLPMLITAVRSVWGTRVTQTLDPPPGHGLVRRHQIAALVDETIVDIVFPGMESVGLDMTDVRKWWQTQAPLRAL